jgi:hypothetical protein
MKLLVKEIACCAQCDFSRKYHSGIIVGAFGYYCTFKTDYLIEVPIGVLQKNVLEIANIYKSIPSWCSLEDVQKAQKAP